MTPEELQQYLASLRTGGVPTDAGIVPAQAPDPNLMVRQWLASQPVSQIQTLQQAPLRPAYGNPNGSMEHATSSGQSMPLPRDLPVAPTTNAVPPNAGIDWAAVSRSPATMGGLSGATRASGAPSTVADYIANSNLSNEQLQALLDRNRQSDIQAVKGMAPLTVLKSADAAAKLEAETPKPQDSSYYRRLAASLPFWSDKLNGMDFSGARDHAMAVDKEERGALGEAMKMRQLGIDRKMGYATADNTSQNAATEFQNKLLALSSKAEQESPSAIDARLKTLGTAATMQNSNDSHAASEAGADRRTAAQIGAANGRANANPLAVMAQNLGEEVRAGRMTNETATKTYNSAVAGKQKEPAALSSTEATWIDSTAQSLLGKKINTPQGQDLYLKFRMAASIPGMQTAAQKALYDDIHSTKW